MPMEMLAQLLPFIFLIAIMYFIIIRPQQQQAKRHQEMLNNLQRGDKIVTNGGLIVITSYSIHYTKLYDP